jgi:hypothetical protein
MQKIIQNQAIQPYEDEIDLRELFQSFGHQDV